MDLSLLRLIDENTTEGIITDIYLGYTGSVEYTIPSGTFALSLAFLGILYRGDNIGKAEKTMRGEIDKRKRDSE